MRGLMTLSGLIAATKSGASGAAVKLACALPVVLLLTAALIGCALDQTAQQRSADLKQQAKAASDACESRFPSGNARTEVARSQCINNALAILMPTFGTNQDLVQRFMANRMVIAERVQNGNISWAEGMAEIQAKWSEVVTESRRRGETTAAADWQAFGQSVAAANQAYAAGLAQSPPVQVQPMPPVSQQTFCNQSGNMTTCNGPGLQQTFCNRIGNTVTCQ
jgi:hypothetical protein